jgi:carbohydrate diacid regulator
MLVRQLGKADVAAMESLQAMFPDRQRDFVVSVSETDIAVVKELPQSCDDKYLQEIAESIEQKLSDDLNLKTSSASAPWQST